MPLPSPGQAAVAGEVELPELIFEYRETRVFVSHLGCGLQFDCEPGSFLVLGGKRYELQQFHFHTPAEHTVAGVTAAMELHLVHRRSDDDFAVVGLLLHLADEDNPFVEKLWRKMPSEPLRFALETPLRADEALPDRRDYFHYRGSLTTPDCAEVVSWFVLEEQMSISRAQLDRYLERVGENARPLQPLNGRVILQGPAR